MCGQNKFWDLCKWMLKRAGEYVVIVNYDAGNVSLVNILV